MVRALSSGSCLLLILAMGLPPVRAAEPAEPTPRVERVGDTTYFHVTLPMPKEADLPSIPKREEAPEGYRRARARQPRLIPLDDTTAAVYLLNVSWRNDTLEFVGKATGKGVAQLELQYPTVKKPSDDTPTLAPSFRRQGWGEKAVTLDFRKAEAAKDVRELWAKGQGRYFANLEALTPDFAFYTFAREATNRKYEVAVRPEVTPDNVPREQEFRRLYEQTTGATALAESLATRRLLGGSQRDNGERTVPIDRVRGIDIAEHPWEKMMAGKKPQPEPMAKLIPHDNYYITFQNIAKFIDFGELLDHWGTNVLSAYQLTSRDARLKQRYEKQLCLRSTGIAKTLGPALIRDVAITGSDPYIREGSDVTVLFHVKDAKLFLAAVNPFLDEARKEFGAHLKETKSEYKDATIESYTTPLREVSLHRTVVGDYVLYSNSPAGLQRVLDARAGRRKNLAESLDFQYMRTVFERGDQREDGFAFLSDAFIRQLVGPAGKIREKRRLEALASLNLVTHGALFAAWETGKLPADHKTLMKESLLRNAEIYTPEGDGVIWDGERQTAVSDVYGTLRFLTPLVELPMDKVTATEANDYRAFREEYLRLWRRYFDPVGMRFALTDKQVRVETYILPLINNSEYNDLRQWAGGGVTTLDLNSFSPKTLFQFMTHIAPERRGEPFFGGGKPLGDWILFRFDDSPVYRELAELWVRSELEPMQWREFDREALRLVFKSPFTLGVRVGNQQDFDRILKQLGNFLHSYGGPCKTDVLKPDYKGVQVTRVRFDKDSQLAKDLFGENPPAEKKFAPTYYHAQVDGAWYFSFSETALREQIDRSVARRDGKEPAKGEKVELNSSVYVAPEAAFRAGGVIQAFLEWESHKRAVANGPYWYALYRGGVLDPHASKAVDEATALKFYGFVPVSPDGWYYVYDAKTDDVRNARHGSLARPTLHDSLDEKGPLNELLSQLRTVRAELRFREDGVHSTVTIERQPAAK